MTSIKIIKTENPLLTDESVIKETLLDLVKRTQNNYPENNENLVAEFFHLFNSGDKFKDKTVRNIIGIGVLGVLDKKSKKEQKDRTRNKSRLLVRDSKNYWINLGQNEAFSYTGLLVSDDIYHVTRRRKIQKVC